jgi:hypothetical protein
LVHGSLGSSEGSSGEGRLLPSVVERQSAVAGELHQRRRALELGVLDQLRFVEPALVEADRAQVEAAALLDELRMDPLDRRVLIGADRIDVALQRQSDAVRGEPDDDVLALVEGSTRRR